MKDLIPAAVLAAAAFVVGPPVDEYPARLGLVSWPVQTACTTDSECGAVPNIPAPLYLTTPPYGCWSEWDGRYCGSIADMPSDASNYIPTIRVT